MAVAIIKSNAKEWVGGSMIIKIQDKQFDIVEDIKFKLVRTYKGEILRTISGKIPSFPLSFITVGFDISFLGVKEEIQLLEQLLLSADILTIELTYNFVPIKGNFSMTSHEVEILKDRNYEYARMTASIVSDGSNITKPSGSGFIIKKGASTIASNLPFGKIYKFTQTYYYKGAKLPNNQVLVLGDMELD